MATTTFDIVDYGAARDGGTLNTAAIQQAVDACHNAGGGRVLCGPGTWLTGSVLLKSHVELHLARGCRLVGSPKLEHYHELTAPGYHQERAPERSSQYLIGAVEARNIAVTGTGVIDGSGLAFYDEPATHPGKFAKPATPRPRTIMFFHCEDARLEEVTLVDAPCWACWFMQCQRLRVHRVNIRSDWRMRNVDGVDIDACRDVVVSDCIFQTEDDCIVLRAIQSVYDEPAICENVTVSNCVLETTCNGVRIGCPSDAIIRNATFTNLVIRGLHGIMSNHPHMYFKEDAATFADIHDLLFSNVVIESSRAPIWINIEDGLRLTRLGDLRFADMSLHSPEACIIHGSDRTLIENVRLTNLDIHTTGDDAIRCQRCRGVKLTNVELSNYEDFENKQEATLKTS